MDFQFQIWEKFFKIYMSQKNKTHKKWTSSFNMWSPIHRVLSLSLNKTLVVALMMLFYTLNSYFNPTDVYEERNLKIF
jgi:hypothetical protein